MNIKKIIILIVLIAVLVLIGSYFKKTTSQETTEAPVSSTNNDVPKTDPEILYQNNKWGFSFYLIPDSDYPTEEVVPDYDPKPLAYYYFDYKIEVYIWQKDSTKSLKKWQEENFPKEFYYFLKTPKEGILNGYPTLDLTYEGHGGDWERHVFVSNGTTIVDFSTTNFEEEGDAEIDKMLESFTFDK